MTSQLVYVWHMSLPVFPDTFPSLLCRVWRDSRLGLERAEKWVKKFRFSLVSVSKQPFDAVLGPIYVSQHPFYVTLGLVSVSQHPFYVTLGLVSVSQNSRVNEKLQGFSKSLQICFKPLYLLKNGILFEKPSVSFPWNLYYTLTFQMANTKLTCHKKSSNVVLKLSRLLFETERVFHLGLKVVLLLSRRSLFNHKGLYI